MLPNPLELRKSTRFTPQGQPSNISGYAYLKDASQPGKLTVHLEGVPEGQYWIVGLGPIENGVYQYSIVSGPLRVALFVLARDPVDFKQRFDSKVQEELKSLFFIFPWNKPIPTLQDGCWGDDSS